MINTKKRVYILGSAILLIVLALGIGTVLAQTADPDDLPEGTPDVLPEFGGRDGFDGRSHGDNLIDNDQLMADALGITVEELQAARQEAMTGVIAQAVDAGLMSQEQADALLSGDRRLNRLPFDAGFDTYLAEALGISEEDLQTAREDAQAARVAALVEAGVMTQEQADMAAARSAVSEYFDREAIAEMIQDAYATAVADALADGAINQDQADQLLENAQNFDGRLPQFDGGPRGHGAPGGHGGPRGHR